jgi:hypothetical protein
MMLNQQLILDVLRQHMGGNGAIHEVASERAQTIRLSNDVFANSFTWADDPLKATSTLFSDSL